MVDRASSLVRRLGPQDVTSKRMAMALEWWCDSGGLICRQDKRLNALFPSLQVFANNGQDWPLPILCVGPNCAFARQFGNGSISELINAATTGLYSQGYLQVRQSRRPVVEYVQCRMMIAGPQRYWTSYRRLILPGRLSAAGRGVFLVLYEIERTLRAIEGGNTKRADLA